MMSPAAAILPVGRATAIGRSPLSPRGRGGGGGEVGAVPPPRQGGGGGGGGGAFTHVQGRRHCTCIQAPSPLTPLPRGERGTVAARLEASSGSRSGPVHCHYHENPADCDAKS